ncbi:hypothetical protein CCP3SC15_380010 [Gammaproteobacteria bacterium]
MTDNAIRVMEYLSANANGHENAVTLKRIALALSIPKRAVEMATEDIRESQRVPLCSESMTDIERGIKPGMFIAVNADEMRRYYQQCNNRVRKICIHRAVVEKVAKAMFGVELQTDLFDTAKVA